MHGLHKVETQLSHSTKVVDCMLRRQAVLLWRSWALTFPIRQAPTCEQGNDQVRDGGSGEGHTCVRKKRRKLNRLVFVNHFGTFKTVPLDS